MIVGSSLILFSNTPGINSEPQQLYDFVFVGTIRLAGGAIVSVSSNIRVADSIFMQNSAAFGGGISARDSNITIIRCTCSNNSATSDGGAIAVRESSVDIDNSIFSAILEE